MVILKKQGQKDFYDWVESVYGRDELIVYDRRDAFPIDPAKHWGCEWDMQYSSQCSDYQNTNIERWFRKEPIYGDKKRETIKRWNTNKILEYKDQDNETKDMGWKKREKVRNSWEEIKEGQIYHFVLEVGYHHYFFEVERYIDDEDETRLHLNYGFIEKKDIKKDEKISYAPVCLCPCSYRKGGWLNSGEGKFNITEKMLEQKIDNPILYSTYIPKFIDPHEMWNNIYEYISSLRDKDIVDTRTNEQHIESHGFDKRISFRHRKKA